VVFLDETGLMLQPLVRRTWVPKARTPMMYSWDRHDRLSVIASLMAHEFAQMVHDRQAEALDGWIERTHGVGVPHELAVFADGLLPDYDAVKAAPSLEWSNGQVEGQVHRLKMIKRQMYGRAGFDLLRQRVLNAG
jgi:transposase